MDWRIPLFKIHWDENDVERVASAIRRGMFWATGPEVGEFETRLCEYFGVKYAVTVNSGTSALHAALLAHGIGPGDEVIVPSFTFIATANAPLFVGAKPVFAEIEDETFGLKPDDVVKRITPRTRAIIPVHYGGCPCYCAELAQIARKHGLILIEDAAESFGAMVDGRKVGTFGGSAILSFCAPKIITTGEGGAVITDSKDLYERAKLICSHGRAETADYFSSTEPMDYVTLGYNFRMSTMTAALGLAQIEKVDEIISRRRENANYLSEKLLGIKGIAIPDPPDQYFHTYQMYTIRVNNKDTRDKLMLHLLQKKIMAKVYFQPVHLTQFYRREFGYREGDLPLTEKITAEVLTLPMYPTLTKEDMDYMAQQIRDFFIHV